MKENIITITFAINVKKSALKKDDYKIIKCMEAQLKGEPMPYDVEELTAKRNALREEINTLEQKITTLKEENANAKAEKQQALAEKFKAIVSKKQ